jgi:glycosyltransferase involved in cell wall biosynthesis
MHKISIVTACRNAGACIAGTIESVIKQTDRDFEYIIVDGASKDDTIDIVRKYQETFPIKLISEKDESHFDAMNKGARMAQGQWINFMNAGDHFFSDDVIEKISGYLTDDRDLVYGATEFLYDGFSVVRKPRPISDFWKKMPYNHQGLFIKTDIVREHPFVYHEYPLAADYEQTLFAIKSKKVFLEAPLTVASFDNTGLSNTRTTQALREYALILSHYRELTFGRRLYYDLAPVKVFCKKLSPNWVKKITYNYFVR